MNLPDAIEQARHIADLYPEESAAYIWLTDLLAALDDALPHMIDTRRLEALARDSGFIWLDYSTCGPVGQLPWMIAGLGVSQVFADTAAEALDAAEREAQP